MSTPLDCADSDSNSSSCDSNQTETETTFHTMPMSSKFLEALSPSGNLYGILWPIIIGQATDEQRNRCLCQVNAFFAGVVRRVISEIAKEESFMVNWYHERRPVSLDLPVTGVDWASWGAKRLEFGEIDNFREFCALGDVDPDKGASQYDSGSFPLDHERHSPEMSWIFISRTRDVIFDTSLHNPNLEEDSYAHYFGITGRADKVKRMYQYIVESEGMSWDYLDWGRRTAI